MLAGSEASYKAAPRAVVLRVIDMHAVPSYPGLGWPRRTVAGCQDRVTRDSIICVIFSHTFGVRYYQLMLCVYGRK